MCVGHHSHILAQFTLSHFESQALSPLTYLSGLRRGAHVSSVWHQFICSSTVKSFANLPESSPAALSICVLSRRSFRSGEFTRPSPWLRVDGRRLGGGKGLFTSSAENRLAVGIMTWHCENRLTFNVFLMSRSSYTWLLLPSIEGTTVWERGQEWPSAAKEVFTQKWQILTAWERNLGFVPRWSMSIFTFCSRVSFTSPANRRGSGSFSTISWLGSTVNTSESKCGSRVWCTWNEEHWTYNCAAYNVPEAGDEFLDGKSQDWGEVWARQPSAAS